MAHEKVETGQKEEAKGAALWRAIEKMTPEELVRNALFTFTFPYGDLNSKISQVMKRALVVRGLTSEEGAELFAKISKESAISDRKSRNKNA